MGAAGAWKMYEQAKGHLGTAIFNLPTSAFKATLHASTGNQDTLSGSSVFADLTGELATGNGYTAGGQALTGDGWTNSAGVWTFTCNNVIWTPGAGQTLTARSIVIRASGTFGGLVDPILLTSLLDKTPADVSVSNGNPLTVQINVQGVFQMSGMTTN